MMRLRQIALVAHTLDGVTEDLTEVLGIEAARSLIRGTPGRSGSASTKESGRA